MKLLWHLIFLLLIVFLWSTCVLSHSCSAESKDHYNRPLETVISILSYKVLCNSTKCLVSAHTLLSECLTIALFFSLDLFSDLLSVCLYHNCTVSHDCSQRISSVSIAVNSQFLQRDLSELNVHILEICHTCEALVYWVTHVLLSQKITMTDL